MWKNWHLKKGLHLESKPEAVLRMKDLCTVSVSLLKTSAIAVTRLDLCCNVSYFLFFSFLLVWDEREDHWFSLLILPEPKDNDLFHVLSSVGWVYPSLLALFSHVREIQSQSNCKILTALKPCQGHLRSANTFIDHFCDKDWKKYRK